MTSDKMQALTSMSTRQKAIAAVFVVVIAIILWQLIGIFSGGSSSTTPAKSTAATVAPGKTATGAAAVSAKNLTPKVVDIMQTQPTTAREAELMKIQQETEMKYMQALNELQVLKIRKEIANTNKDISAAQLSKVQAEKKIVDLLAPPPPPPVAESVNKPVQTSFAVSGLDLEAKYTVISVSQLRSKWNAVLNYKGSLFSVGVGDVLPPDGSVVLSISKNGVTIERDGNKRKISIMSAI